MQGSSCWHICGRSLHISFVFYRSFLPKGASPTPQVFLFLYVVSVPGDKYAYNLQCRPGP